MDHFKEKMHSRWTFEFKNEKLTDKELKEYQDKLIEIRERYESLFKCCSRVKFHKGEAPPEDNVFATFTYECKLHANKNCQSKNYSLI